MWGSVNATAPQRSACVDCGFQGSNRLRCSAPRPSTGDRHGYPQPVVPPVQRGPGPGPRAPLGHLQHLQRLDLGRAQPLGLLPGRQPVPAVRQLRQLHPGDRHQLAGHLLPDEPGGLCRRQDRRAVPGAGARLVRHLGRQPAGAGARGGGLLLVRRADRGGLGRHRRAAHAQRFDHGIPPDHAPAGPLRPGGDLLCGGLGAAAADHPERHGDRAQVPGLGRPRGVGGDAGAGHRPVRQGRRLLVRPRHSAGGAAGQDQGRRASRASPARSGP